VISFVNILFKDHPEDCLIVEICILCRVATKSVLYSKKLWRMAFNWLKFFCQGWDEGSDVSKVKANFE